MASQLPLRAPLKTPVSEDDGVLTRAWQYYFQQLEAALANANTPGPAGPAGAAGADGPAGKAGKDGTNGSSIARVTFNFSFLTAGVESSHARVPQSATNFSPLALDINAVTAPIAGDAIFDIQTSPDDNTWTSILTAPMHLVMGNTFAPTVVVFAGVLLIPNNWVRAVLVGGSDLTATNINVELTVTISSSAVGGGGNVPAVNFADDETPAGAINGTNLIFTLALTPSPGASLILSLTGAILTLGTDYTLVGNTITLTLPGGYAPVAGVDWLRAWYRHA